MKMVDIPPELATDAVNVANRIEADIKIGRPVQIGRLLDAAGKLIELLDALGLRKAS